MIIYYLQDSPPNYINFLKNLDKTIVRIFFENKISFLRFKLINHNQIIN